jgi:hypothetical protein
MLFAGAIAVVYAVAISLSGRLASIDGADLLAIGLTLDLVLVVPALWYLLVVRRLGWPWISVAPVAILSVVAAGQVIPAPHRGALTIAEWMLIPLELAVLGFIGWKAVRAARRMRSLAAGSTDMLATIRSATREVIPARRAAEIAASEVAMFHYGLAAWGRPAPTAPDEFTVHEKSAYGSVIAGLMLLTAMELFPVHLLLSRWSPLAAWTLTALSLYGALWLLADWRATRLRTIRLSAAGLHLRAGLRWDILIPLERVRSIERFSAADADPKPLKLTAFGDPDLLVTTDRPVEALGLYGFTRRTDRFAVAVDAPARLIEAWAAAADPSRAR